VFTVIIARRFYNSDYGIFLGLRGLAKTIFYNLFQGRTTQVGLWAADQLFHIFWATIYQKPKENQSKYRFLFEFWIQFGPHKYISGPQVGCPWSIHLFRHVKTREREVASQLRGSKLILIILHNFHIVYSDISDPLHFFDVSDPILTGGLRLVC
jgi:hypothetical protein